MRLVKEGGIEGGGGREGAGWREVGGGRCCCTAAGGSCWESRDCGEAAAAAPADLLFVYLPPGHPSNSLTSSDTFSPISDLRIPLCELRNWLDKDSK